MDYNQQRRSRGGYGGRRSGNPGCGCQSAPAQPNCGCQPAQAQPNCGRQSAPVQPNCGRQSAPAQPNCGRQSVQAQPNCGRQPVPAKPDCGCGNGRSTAGGIDSFEIAMAYVPWQTWKGTYDPHRSLMSGTIFPELDKPFCAAGRCNR